MTPVADFEDASKDSGQPQCFDQSAFFVNSVQQQFVKISGLKVVRYREPT